MPKKTSSIKTEPVALTPAETSIALAKKTRKPKAPKAETTESAAVVPVVVSEIPQLSVVDPVQLILPTSVKKSSDPSVSEVVTDLSTIDLCAKFAASLHASGVNHSLMKAEFKLLEKKMLRELKVAQKQSSKRKRKAGNRAPSGFVKPTIISDELASFLGKEKGTEMARTEVTREINTYIRAHNLQDKDNGRKINPDTKLAALLKLNKTDELTYFNLQKYMSPHFPKSIKVVAASAISV
jgi:upstream activation factor subunit UAF30